MVKYHSYMYNQQQNITKTSVHQQQKNETDELMNTQFETTDVFVRFFQSVHSRVWSKIEKLL